MVLGSSHGKTLLFIGEIIFTAIDKETANFLMELIKVSVGVIGKMEY